MGSTTTVAEVFQRLPSNHDHWYTYNDQNTSPQHSLPPTPMPMPIPLATMKSLALTLLLASLAAASPALQSRQTCPTSGISATRATEIQNAFRSAGIIADVPTGEFTPTTELTVKYGNRNENLGNSFAVLGKPTLLPSPFSFPSYFPSCFKTPANPESYRNPPRAPNQLPTRGRLRSSDDALHLHPGRPRRARPLPAPPPKLPAPHHIQPRTNLRPFVPRYAGAIHASHTTFCPIAQIY